MNKRRIYACDVTGTRTTVAERGFAVVVEDAIEDAVDVDEVDDGVDAFVVADDDDDDNDDDSPSAVASI
jgi:hypothetical protein